MGGSTVVETTVLHIMTADIGEVIVVTGYEAERVQRMFASKAVQVAYNPDYATGMTSSIQAGIRVASPGASGFMICLADMPLILPEEYSHLAQIFANQLSINSKAIVQPYFGDQPGNPVVFSAYYRTDILNVNWPEGCKPIVQANRTNIYPITFTTNHFVVDLDTPADYQSVSK